MQPGMDADFVVLSGDPLAVGTLVEQTWVDGERAYARKTWQNPGSGEPAYAPRNEASNVR